MVWASEGLAQQVWLVCVLTVSETKSVTVSRCGVFKSTWC